MSAPAWQVGDVVLRRTRPVVTPLALSDEPWEVVEVSPARLRVVVRCRRTRQIEELRGRGVQALRAPSGEWEAEHAVDTARVQAWHELKVAAETALWPVRVERLTGPEATRLRDAAAALVAVARSLGVL